MRRATRRPDRSSLPSLHQAVFAGNREAVITLLDKGASIHEKDSLGIPCLLWAIRAGHEEIVRLLLERGADAKVVDGIGRTSLIWAVERTSRDGRFPISVWYGNQPC